MKYLITTKDGLSEFTELKDTPKLKDIINYNNQKYKVIHIEHFENHIELKVRKYPFEPPKVSVKWN